MRTAYEVEADLESLEKKLNALQRRVAEDRTWVTEACAAAQGMMREEKNRSRRLQVIVSERESWKVRMSGTQEQHAKLIFRCNEVSDELNKIEEVPDEAENRRKVLSGQMEDAETRRKTAVDDLARAESKLRQAEQLAKQALFELSQSKEQLARTEERMNAARGKRSDIELRIVEELNYQPHETKRLAELPDDVNLPDALKIERYLEKLKNERERLGAVNLRAEIERQEISDSRQSIISERDDLIKVLSRLRQGVVSLNREGRGRLLEAFGNVKSVSNIYLSVFLVVAMQSLS